MLVTLGVLRVNCVSVAGSLCHQIFNGSGENSFLYVVDLSFGIHS